MTLTRTPIALVIIAALALVPACTPSDEGAVETSTSTLAPEETTTTEVVDGPEITRSTSSRRLPSNTERSSLRSNSMRSSRTTSTSARSPSTPHSAGPGVRRSAFLASGTAISGWCATRRAITDPSRPPCTPPTTAEQASNGRWHSTSYPPTTEASCELDQTWTPSSVPTTSHTRTERRGTAGGTPTSR